MASQWSHRNRVTESEMSPSPCWIFAFYTDTAVAGEILISLIKDKISSLSYTTSFLALVSVVWYHTEYGWHTITPARIAKYCLNVASVSPDKALLGLQENVFRESPGYSDFLLEVVSLSIFLLCPILDLDVTWVWCAETFLRRVWWSKVYFLKSLYQTNLVILAMVFTQSCLWKESIPEKESLLVASAIWLTYKATGLGAAAVVSIIRVNWMEECF